MPIRDYNFVTGAETATLPTATTPSASTDLITKGYFDANSTVDNTDITALTEETTPAKDDFIIISDTSAGSAKKTLLGNLSKALVSAVVSKTTTYTAAVSDEVILCSASGGAWTLTLPTAVGITGKVYKIKKTDASVNAVTIGTTSSETIDGSTTFPIDIQYTCVTVVSDGSNWQVI